MANNLCQECGGDLIDCLTSDTYKNLIAHVLNNDIMRSQIEIIFKRYFPGDYISPHTDRNFVYGTHLLFFNKQWNNSWGGLLQILTPQQEIVKEIPPLHNTSFLFPQSDKSWHAVNRLSEHANIRYCLQITFWRQDSKIRTPGRMEVNLK